jgi:uncharacterized protein (DUF362 family)
MSRYNVSIIPQENYNSLEISEKIGEYFDNSDYDFKDKSILLKPSFVLPIADATRIIATNTNVNLVAGIAKALSERGACPIYIAENKTMGTARYIFSRVGIKKVVKGIKNVRMSYLDEKKRQNITVEAPFIENHVIKYPKMLVDNSIDYFISVPKLKGNLYADVTLSVKNNLGLISKKERLKYHDTRLHDHLSDITLIRQPDLIIADTIISGEGNGPAEVNPIETHMMIVGDNCLAVDITCCYLIGKDPKEVKHLKNLAERGLGPINIQDIEINNREYLESKKRIFADIDRNLNVHPNLQLFQGKENCDSGCPAFLRSYLDAYGKNLGWDTLSGMTIIVGNDLVIPEEKLANLDKKKTIVYGDCVEQYKKYGLFCRGCPPDYVKAMFKISYRTSLPKFPYFKYVSYPRFLTTWIIHLLHKLLPF